MEEKLFPEVEPGQYFWLRDGSHLKSLVDLHGALERIDEETYRYHANENKNDFSNWVKEVHKNNWLANDISNSTTKEDAAIIVGDLINKVRGVKPLVTNDDKMFNLFKEKPLVTLSNKVIKGFSKRPLKTMDRRVFDLTHNSVVRKIEAPKLKDLRTFAPNRKKTLTREIEPVNKVSLEYLRFKKKSGVNTLSTPPINLKKDVEKTKPKIQESKPQNNRMLDEMKEVFGN